MSCGRDPLRKTQLFESSSLAPPESGAMAASSGDDILAQLAALLGRESVCHIRKTDTVPPQVSVIDVAAAITGKSHDAAAQDFRRMSKKYPDVNAKCTDVKFPDARGRQGQRKQRSQMSAAFVMALPGRMASRVRATAAG